MGRFTLAFVAACFAGAAAPTPAGEPRPNVLWIYLEDVSGWFSCTGEKLIDTPHIDRLAAQGTRFTRFYTTAGVCSATRSAVMLGAMQTTYGVHHHRSSRNNAAGTKHDGIGMIHLPEGVVPLPQWCRQHGGAGAASTCGPAAVHPLSPHRLGGVQHDASGRTRRRDCVHAQRAVLGRTPAPGPEQFRHQRVRREAGD